MSYLVMGLAFAAIGFLAATTAFSALAVVLWRMLGRSMRRPGALLLLRLLPAAGAALAVAGVAIPAYLRFEPHGTGERPGPWLVAIVLVAVALAASGLFRVFASWRMTRRLERTWLRVGRPTACDDLAARVYLVPSDLPFAGLVGVVRPRLYVSDRFFEALSAEERRAVLRHEAGHLLSADNLKRALIRLAPDWLALTSIGDEIETAWAAAAEEAADDHAAGADAAGGLAVAGALLKASRLFPLRLATVSNFCDGATIARRVGRLLEERPVPSGPAPRRVAPELVVAAASLALLAAAASALPAAYEALESVVRLLR